MKFWSNKAKSISPYTYGEQPKDKKYIKLNTNENPYPPSPKAIKIIKNLDENIYKLYSDPTCNELKEAISKVYNVEKKQIFIGNGSDEVIAFSYQSFFNKGDKIVYPDITYSFYPVYSKLYEIEEIINPLNDDFTMNLKGFNKKSKGIIITNPNAPTGIALTLDQIESIIKDNLDKLIIVDEAYVDFGAESAVKLINKYENLLVIQTFSKSRSFASLRIGFAIGNKELIQALHIIKDSYNPYTVDTIGIKAGAAAMLDVEYFNKTRNTIIATRDRIKKELDKLGFKSTNSKSNFLFIKHNSFKGEYIFKKLKENGILVRYFNKPKINNYLRVSIGTDEEMDEMIRILKEKILK
ncbi:histidinol-phosphate aminotransferase [Hypnocyclicus thermotrophus]|uniref:Histidinol-phosphate aminotransferase n=1 Tax=Hypnocyclicus thermotrophus TaxID=1627895 RepID=A0AA46I5Y2_9FUSO|nr:histidinol-phosphate transaminase [Hypnocyclicus thermotrophus]TDT71460.1 histidinol-phosphate aminotransferase [Hypnocyclicus thermotrophus]